MQKKWTNLPEFPIFFKANWMMTEYGHVLYSISMLSLTNNLTLPIKKVHVLKTQHRLLTGGVMSQPCILWTLSIMWSSQNSFALCRPATKTVPAFWPSPCPWRHDTTRVSRGKINHRPSGAAVWEADLYSWPTRGLRLHRGSSGLSRLVHKVFFCCDPHFRPKNIFASPPSHLPPPFSLVRHSTSLWSVL